MRSMPYQRMDALIMPVEISTTKYSSPKKSTVMTATIISSILLSDSLGGMILPSVTGLIVEQFGAPMMTWLVSASLVGNILMFMLRLRLRKANNPLPA
jgi:fucose permease